MKTKNLIVAALAFASVAFSAPAQAQVLVDGYPQLTVEMVDEIIKVQEIMLEMKMKPNHRERFTRVMVSEWQKPGSTIQQDTVNLVGLIPQLMALPQRTRELAIKANLIQFLVRLDRDAKAGDEISQVLLAAYKDAHKPIVPEAPLFTPMIADAYIDAFLFVGEVKSGKPAPKLSQQSRQALRAELARDYVRMNPQQLEAMTNGMGKVTTYRIQWAEGDPYTRLLIRADLGAQLSPDEQSMVVQLRQQQGGGTNWQLLQNEIGFMKQNENVIMGSAPYWNPTTNAWEQKGGIVTEFH